MASGVDNRSFQDKLDSTRLQVQSVMKTDAFDVESTVQNSKDPTFHDPYKSNHKSSIKCSIFFGPIWISEIVGVEHREENSKTPVYHYASEYFDDVLDGKYIVRGNLYIFETKTNEILGTIAKYKELLRREKYSKDLIKDIVSQRNNLLAADINVRLISKYGPQEAAKIVNQALKRVNSEIITGRDWDLPRLVIVSGDITDPEPAIDVFEDVTFDTSSKAILADGATQIKVISWFGRRRPFRDTPESASLLGKKRIDFDATVRSYMDSFMTYVRNSFRVDIRDISIPVTLNPNNVGFMGSLPPAIAGWGPEMCLTPVKVEQYGLPEIVSFNYDIHVYQTDSPAESADSIIQENKPFEYREYKREQVPRRADLANLWRHWFPDPDFLVMNTAFISRALPTHRSLSYSWIIPTPAIPGAVEDNPIFSQNPLGDPLVVKNYGDYTFREEDTHAVTGSTLMAAYMSIAMYRDYSEKTGGFIRDPVRSMFYIPTPMIKAEKSGSDSYKLLMRDYKFLQQGDFLTSLSSDPKLSIPDDFLSGTPLKNTFDVLSFTDGKSEAIDVVSKYEAEVWFALAPLGLVDSLTSFSSALSEFLENITLGILGNNDKVNQYDIDLQDEFGRVSYGRQIDAVGVQVFPIGVPKSKASIANSALGSLSLAFGSHAKLNRDLAANLLYQCDCVKSTEIDYLYSLTGFDQTGFDKKLLFSATWKKETLARLLREEKLPLLLVRVVSDRRGVPEGRIANSLRNIEYVSPVTTMPCSKAVYTAIVRCDRSMFSFDDRWPKDIFTVLSRISANAGMNFYRVETDKALRLFAGSLRAMKHEGVWRGFVDNVIGGGIGALQFGGAGLVTSAVGFSAKTIGVFGSAVLDSVEGIWNVAIHLPIVNTAVDVLDSVGLDLTTLFQDTFILRGGQEGFPNINLLRTSVYNTGERYVLIKDELSKQLSRNITDDIRNLIASAPEDYEGDELLASGSFETGGRIFNRVDTQLVSALNRYFSSPDWTVDHIYGEDIDRLVGFVQSRPGESLFTNAGSKTDQVYLVTRRSARPSAFVLDEAIKDKDAYRSKDPTPRGIIF